MHKNEKKISNEIRGFVLYHNNRLALFIDSKILKIEKDKSAQSYITQKKEFLDLSNTKATQKIIYHKELGILDYLQKKEPFSLSTNSLATVLSAITGEKPETLQSYLNPIINPNSGQKNNPLNNNKNVKSIRQTLTNLGFNLFQ